MQGPRGFAWCQPLPRVVCGAPGLRDLVTGGPQQARRAQLPQGAQRGGEGTTKIYFWTIEALEIHFWVSGVALPSLSNHLFSFHQVYLAFSFIFVKL